MSQNKTTHSLMNKKQLVSIFNHNMQLIYKTYDSLNLTALADKLNIPSSTLSRFLDEKNTVLPQTSTLYHISQGIGINMEVLLTEKINNKQLPDLFFKPPVEENKRLNRYICGKNKDGSQESYRLYYCNTDPAGNQELIHEGELIVSLNSENDKAAISVTANFGLNIGADKRKHCEGHIAISGDHVYINLETTGITGERVLIILLHQNSDSDYKGGVGIITSISRGRKKTPCTQKVIISKRPLKDVEKETILPDLLKFEDSNFVMRITEELDQCVYKKLLVPTNKDHPDDNCL